MDYSFGKWVKRRRKALDLTQEQLAQQIGCSSSAIFKIEADERRPSRQIAGLLAKHLGIPVEQHAQFLKIARQEIGTPKLEAIAQFYPDQPAPRKEQPKSGLPIPPMPMIGRENEIRMVIEQLRDPACRLLTLTGPGGVGKTRLALDVAHQMLSEFSGSVHFISLIGTASAEFIVPAIADAVGFSFSGANDPKTQLLHFFKDKHLLLVIDNLEHLLHGIGVLPELLACGSGIKILATSREQLNLQAEWVFGVQGLPIPHHLSLETMPSNSAAVLFLQRARQLQLDFAITADDLPAIERICQLVDGSPLGIELAAAWTRAISCREIVHEIEHNIDFLTTNARDVPHRHRSMHAVFDYSWDLLSEGERRALMSLSVFRGGFARRAAEQVAGADLPLLSKLMDKSLVQRSSHQRFELHEMIRQYAQLKLSQAGELDETCDRHLEFFLAMAEESRSKLRGPEQLAWLNALEEDHENLRAALTWSLRFENSSEAPTPQMEKAIQASLKLTAALVLFWKMRNHWSEGRIWLQRALAQPASQIDSPERAWALNAAVLLATEQADLSTALRLADENLALAVKLDDLCLRASVLHANGVVFWKQKDFFIAERLCTQSAANFRVLGEKLSLAGSLQILGRIAINQHQLDLARIHLDECARIFQQFGNNIEYSAALSDLGLLAYLRKDYATSRHYHQQSLELFRSARNIAGIEMSLNRLGDLARCEDDYETAGRLYQECLDIYQETGDKDEIASLFHNLGYVVLKRSETEKALKLFKNGLLLQCELENQAGIAECLGGIAGVLTSLGQSEQAARFFGAAETLREKAEAVLWPANQLEYERSLVILENPLAANTELQQAWAKGRALSVKQACDEALALQNGHHPSG